MFCHNQLQSDSLSVDSKSIASHSRIENLPLLNIYNKTSPTIIYQLDSNVNEILVDKSIAFVGNPNENISSILNGAKISEIDILPRLNKCIVKVSSLFSTEGHVFLVDPSFRPQLQHLKSNKRMTMDYADKHMCPIVS
jgi:hypothetical protein